MTKINDEATREENSRGKEIEAFEALLTKPLSAQEIRQIGDNEMVSLICSLSRLLPSEK